jgi:hypothetical protein
MQVFLIDYNNKLLEDSKSGVRLVNRVLLKREKKDKKRITRDWLLFFIFFSLFFIKVD